MQLSSPTESGFYVKVHRLAEIMPFALSERIPGVMLSPFEDAWAVMRPSLTMEGQYSLLRIDGLWSDGPWDDDVILTSRRTAGFYANGLNAVSANFADVIRRGRLEEVEPVNPASQEWWDWFEMN